MPGMMLPVVAYAPTAATKPSIAAHPLNLSASRVMIVSCELGKGLSLESCESKEKEVSCKNI